MTENTKKIVEPDFASQEAGEYWAKVKKMHDEKVDIADVEGTGKDGAIKKSNIEDYLSILELEMDDTDTDANDDEEGAKEVGQSESTDNEAAVVVEKVELIKGKKLINNTGNTFVIEGVTIEPNGETELTKELAASKRVAYAIELGVLGTK
jgi:hypothetical protein